MGYALRVSTALYHVLESLGPWTSREVSCKSLPGGYTSVRAACQAFRAFLTRNASLSSINCHFFFTYCAWETILGFVWDTNKYSFISNNFQNKWKAKLNRPKMID